MGSERAVVFVTSIVGVVAVVAVFVVVFVYILLQPTRPAFSRRWMRAGGRLAVVFSRVGGRLSVFSFRFAACLTERQKDTEDPQEINMLCIMGGGNSATTTIMPTTTTRLRVCYHCRGSPVPQSTPLSSCCRWRWVFVGWRLFCCCAACLTQAVFTNIKKNGGTKSSFCF